MIDAIKPTKPVSYHRKENILVSSVKREEQLETDLYTVVYSSV